jgi:large subunit ribosomal protein L19e
MAMNSVRRIASGILGVGESKVRFRQDSLSRISEALTREDVRALVKDGAIFALKPRGVSRVRGNSKRTQMRKGRRFGPGSKRGTPSARKGSKEAWMQKVRAQRRYLFGLVESGKISREAFRKSYLMVKGNAFKGVKMLETHLRDSKLLK